MTGSEPHTKLAALSRSIFSPHSVAVVGASRDVSKIGGRAFALLKDFGFGGHLYPINASGADVQGVPSFLSLLDVPTPIDLVIVAVPRDEVKRVIEESAQRGARVAQILSAGFGEGDSEGRRLEAEIVDVARSASVRLIGPNCVGTYCPSSRLTFTPRASAEPGRVGLASQSGGLAIDIVERGSQMGIRFSKAISIGNCADLGPADFLEIFRDDSHTDVAALYVESVSDGGHFLRVLTSCARSKPTVILKGGRSRAGSESAASHTGALATEYRVWHSAIGQAGAVEVQTAQHMVGVLSCIQCWSVPPGDRWDIALIGNGGGISVLAADGCAERGLNLADLAPRTTNRLRRLAGASAPIRSNPLDLPAAQLLGSSGKFLLEGVAALAGDPAVGVTLLHFNLAPIAELPEHAPVLSAVLERLADIGNSGKRLALVLRSPEVPSVEVLRAQLQASATRYGIPTFRFVEEALDAISAIARNRS